MTNPARVLVVDRSFESRAVLRSLLQRRGALVLEAREPVRGAELAVAEKPDLIVMDAESSGADSDNHERSAVHLATLAAHKHVPIVVVGTWRRGASPLPAADFVAKPYHYRVLIRRIEELLEGRT